MHYLSYHTIRYDFKPIKSINAKGGKGRYTIQSSIQDKNVALNAITAQYNNGTLEVWAGSVPAIDVTPTGTKLISITVPNPAFASATNGQTTKSGTWRTTAALATGTPTFWRLIGSSGAVRQGSAAMNTGAELILTDPDDANATQILANRAFEVTSLTITKG